MFDILGFESPTIASLFNTIANESRLRGEGREMIESSLAYSKYGEQDKSALDGGDGGPAHRPVAGT